MNSDVVLSLLLATRNGAQTLPRLFSTLEKQSPLRAGRWQIVVVDSASEDNTPKIIKEWASKLPILALAATKPGKNIALNLGVDRAEGSLLIFVDDDVLLPVNFLRDYEKLAAEEADFDLFGGHVVAKWPYPPDERILKEIPLGLAYTITEQDRIAGPIAARRLFGPNMAVRRRVFQSRLRFNERIGPTKGSYVMGSETDFLYRAENLGFNAYFAPQISVDHIIRSEQLKASWLEGRAYRAGRAQVHEQLRKNKQLSNVSTILGYPRWAVAGHLFARLKRTTHRVLPSSLGLFEAIWKSGYLRGYADEYKEQRRR